MLDDDLLNVIRGADIADDEDVFLRVALAVALQEGGMGKPNFGSRAAPPGAYPVLSLCRHRQRT